MDMCVPTQVENQRFLQLLLTQQLLVASKGVQWLRIVETAFVYGDTIRTEAICLYHVPGLICEWLGQLRVQTVCGLDSHCLMTDGYTLYDWSLPITREDAIVHYSHKIYPTVTYLARGRRFFPMLGRAVSWNWTGQSSLSLPSSNICRWQWATIADWLTVCNGVKLTSVISYFALRLYQNHGYSLGHIKCSFANWSSDIIISLLTVLCHTQVIMCICVDFINQSVEINCLWISRGTYVSKSE